MMLRATNRPKTLAPCLLLALLLTAAGSVQAQEVHLFPVQPKRPLSAIPADPNALPPLDPKPAVQAQAEPAAVAAPAPSTGGPIRIVIPNINHDEKKSAKKNTHDTPSGTANAQPATAPASTISRVSQAIVEGAQEAWQNGVVLAGNFINQTLLKPNVAFAQLPGEWQVASSVPVGKRVIASDAANNVVVEYVTQPIATRADIASSPKPLPVLPVAQAQAPLAVTAPDTKMVADTQTMAALAPAAGSAPPPNLRPLNDDAPVTNANTQVSVDYSEPAPSLSTQSKAIAQRIPVIEPPKVPRLPAPKVDIERRREIPVILNKSESGPAKEGLGLQTKGVSPKLDISYELERAYNALIAGKSEDAIHIYEDVLTIDPRNKDALFGLASTYHRVGQIDIARALYGKLLEIDPTHRDGLNNFLVLLSDEAPQEALSQMERLEAQNPGFSPIPAQMAIIYQKLGDREKAVDKMYRALALSPENITYRYNLAIMLDKSGKYEQAGKLYSQVITAHARGEVIPGDAAKIQQRLTFIRSNTH